MRGGVPGVVPRTWARASSAARPSIRRPASGPAGRRSARLRDDGGRRGEVDALAATVVDASIAIRLFDAIGRRCNCGRRRAGLRIEALLGRGLRPRWRIGLDRGALDAADRVDDRRIRLPGAAGDPRQGGGRRLQPGAQQRRHEGEHRQGAPQPPGRSHSVRSAVQKPLASNGWSKTQRLSIYAVRLLRQGGRIAHADSVCSLPPCGPLVGEGWGGG
jgi:hypothetical protein